MALKGHTSGKLKRSQSCTEEDSIILLPGFRISRHATPRKMLPSQVRPIPNVAPSYPEGYRCKPKFTFVFTPYTNFEKAGNGEINDVKIQSLRTALVESIQGPMKQWV
jgi:hypothetical protein